MQKPDFYFAPMGTRTAFAPYIYGILLIFFGTYSVSILLTIAFAKTPTEWTSLVMAYSRSEGSFADSWPGLLIFMALAIGSIGLITLLVTRFVHFRKATSVLAVMGRFHWSRVGHGFWLHSLITVPLWLTVVYASPEEYVFSFDWQPFVLLLALSIPTLFIQTAAEEVLTRGYLGQMTAAVVPFRAAVILLPATIFGLLHFANPEFSRGWWMFFPYFWMGVFYALIAMRDEGIEIPIGGHFANNLWIILLFNQEGTVFGEFDIPALFTSASRYDALHQGGGGDALVPGINVPVELTTPEIASLIVFTATLPFLFWLASGYLPKRKNRP